MSTARIPYLPMTFTFITYSFWSLFVEKLSSETKWKIFMNWVPDLPICIAHSLGTFYQWQVYSRLVVSLQNWSKVALFFCWQACSCSSQWLVASLCERTISPPTWLWANPAAETLPFAVVSADCILRQCLYTNMTDFEIWSYSLDIFLKFLVRSSSCN